MIRIRMQDDSKNSQLVGVEKSTGREPFIARTMNPVGGFVSTRHKSEKDAEAEFLKRTLATAEALAEMRRVPVAGIYKELGLTEEGKVPPTAKSHVVTLKEAPQKRSMLETKMRYDVVVNGETVFDTLSFNMRGYIGYLPLRDGDKLHIGECGIAAYKKEIGIINREARAAFDAI